MPVIKITKADIEKLKVLDSGWYGATITKVGDPAPSRDKGSINIPIFFTIDEIGKELIVTINSKLHAMIIPIWETVMGKKVTDELDMNTEHLVGKRLDVKLTTEIYNGGPINKIEGYLPYGQGKTAKAPF